MEKILNFIIIISICIILQTVFFAKDKEIPDINSSLIPIEQLADPIQADYSGDDFISIKDNEMDLKLYPKARYQIYAMVMSKHWYSLGWGGKISPYDLALAWNELMLPENRKGITYSQSGRWYYYRYDAGYPLPKFYIQSHSSNHHIIPANVNVKKAIDKVNTGDKIYLEGFLVYIEGKSEGTDVRWKSSLTREDSGDGACEVLYLTKAVLNDKIYE